MSILQNAITWLLLIAAIFTVIFSVGLFYYMIKKNTSKTSLWKKRALIMGSVAIASFLILSGLNTSINKTRNSTKSFTISGFRVGLSFSQIKQKLPNNATIARQTIEGESYYGIRFGQQQFSFNNNGLLMFILLTKTGTGLDNGLMVGDQESLIMDKMGVPKQQLKLEEGKNLYQYDYPSFEVHFYTKNGNIDTIQMLEKPSQVPVTDNTSTEGQQIIDYYNSKTNTSEGK